MFAVWAAVNLIKRVVVVDDDIDPWDPEQVEWACATRMRAERDLIVIPGVRTDRSEPLDEAGVITKLGIDATRRAQDRADWRGAQPPVAALKKARELLGSTTSADRIGQH
jgi:4-hydroxy-3-polyprenylbenzoate decarboxylase